MDTAINSAFSRALSKVLLDGRFTPTELAEEADCSARHIRKVANQKASLGHDKAERVARYLCRHNETRPTQAFSCAGYELTQRGEAAANGIIDDEMADMMETLGAAVKAHRSKDREGLSSIILDAEAIIQRLKAERDRI